MTFPAGRALVHLWQWFTSRELDIRCCGTIYGAAHEIGRFNIGPAESEPVFVLNITGRILEIIMGYDPYTEPSPWRCSRKVAGLLGYAKSLGGCWLQRLFHSL